MSEVTPEPPTPTFMDHHFLLFWLWAFITDAEAFLQASSDFRVNVRTPDFRQRRIAQMQFELAKYHLVMAMGSMLRQLTRLHLLFPTIKAAYDAAEHLREEGEELRGMIEHADEYMSGRGYKRSRFVREVPAEASLGFPGTRPGTADATSMIVNQTGHWLGGRLNVERALAEAKVIWAEAQKIPPPQPSPPPRRSGRIGSIR